MSRSYRYSPEHSSNRGERQNNRRGDRRERRLIRHLAELADSFVLPPSDGSSHASSRAGGQQNFIPATAMARR